ncbi:MAG: glutaredoxin domain-containing protein [Anaerolineae bacterium]
MKKHLVMYSRTTGCPYITVAKRVLSDYALEYHEIFIDKDVEARKLVQAWTGFLSVPTLVAARNDDMLPYQEPLPIPRGSSPRGINRDSMITEANADQLRQWLAQHGFIVIEDDDQKVS